MTWIIYILAAIGALTVGVLVVGPLLWCLAYATGSTIFAVRCALAGGRVSRWRIAKAVPACWARQFIEGVTSPCSEASVGQLRWVPPFGFHGFGRSNPAE